MLTARDYKREKTVSRLEMSTANSSVMKLYVLPQPQGTSKGIATETTTTMVVVGRNGFCQSRYVGGNRFHTTISSYLRRAYAELMPSFRTSKTNPNRAVSEPTKPD